MKKFMKIAKITLGVIFCLSALTNLSYLPYFGVERHFFIALLQGLIGFFFLKSALKSKPSTTEPTRVDQAQP